MKPFDRTGKSFLVACAALFFLGVFFRLNGSSVFMWKQLLHDPSDTGDLVMASPQPVRSDEWMIWTPAAKWQSEHGFPSENPSLGPGKTPFLYSLPVKHYTAVFRPQLWGFFLFSFERGYAWYWNAKIFGLLAAMFVFFWMLTGRTWLSLFGAFWLFFSNYIQWWFSCPPMLPEMLASWAVALVAITVLVHATTWPIRLAASGAFIVAVTNFILCLYPPFQIPLIYLGVLLVLGAAYRERTQLRFDWKNVACLIGATVAIAALLVPFFFQCRPTFQLLAGTSYPGQRRSHGGELSLIRLFSGLVNFFNSTTSFPSRLNSASDAANFLPLWVPVLAVVASRLWKNPREHVVSIAALLVILGLSCYALLPLPSWFCSLTGLGYCTEERALLAIGVANIIFVTTTLPLVPFEHVRKRLLCLAAVSSAIVLYMVAVQTRGSAFFSPLNSTFVVLDLGFVALLLTGRARALALTLVILLVVSNALVNPVMNGLGPLTISPPAVAIRALTKADPNGRWVSFDTSAYSEFLMAEGANVVSGLKLLPDLAFYGMADPKGSSRDVYNRYSIATFQYRQNKESVDIRSDKFPTHLVSINPRHSSLAAMGVRYFVFEREIAHPERAGLKVLRALPGNRMWIYACDSAADSGERVTSVY